MTCCTTVFVASFFSPLIIINKYDDVIFLFPERAIKPENFAVNCASATVKNVQDFNSGHE